LAPHPEGGCFREVHRSPVILDAGALPPRFGGSRAASTSIYFLLRRGEHSRLHRIASDEVWHFYAGDALTVHCIDAEGTRHDLRLGLDLARGDRPQLTVPAGFWFGARLDGDGEYAIVGCTVAPGFDFADFELADRASLLAAFPAHGALI